MKRSFFQAAVTSILLYGCTTWTLTKRLEKKLDGNYTRMLRAILNKSWQQHPTRHQLYGHLPPIMKTIQVRRTRHAGHCWRSRDELIRDVLLWIPSHGRAKAGRPARTYIQQLCEDTGCCPEDLPRAMNDREEWRERVKDIRATSAIWWWWHIVDPYQHWALRFPLFTLSSWFLSSICWHASFEIWILGKWSTINFMMKRFFSSICWHASFEIWIPGKCSPIDFTISVCRHVIWDLIPRKMHFYRFYNEMVSLQYALIFVWKLEFTE